MLASFALIIVAVLLLYGTLSSRLSSAFVATLVFIGLSLSVGFFAIDRLTGSGIDNSVLYHLSVGLNGASVSDFSGLAAATFLFFVLACVLAVFVYRIVRGVSSAPFGRLRIVAAVAAITASFYFNPAVTDILTLVQPMQKATASTPEYVPDAFKSVEQIQFDGQPKDLVILYLESLERTYLDNVLFPGLMPNLKALEEQALSFTNISQVDGTNWTIAGMVASQCGLPLIGVGANNAMSGVDEFLPGATCMGDLLAQHGYDLNYLGGADLDFAGKGNFYRSHGFANVEGLNELQGRLDQPDYLSAWGLFDDSLYGEVTARFDQLAARETPFALVALTLDTHHPNGYMSQVCADEVYQDGSNSILNSVHCADQMAGAFITHVLESPEFKDTALVVLSDHLAMPNTAWSTLESTSRNNLVYIFDADIPPGTSDKAGTTFDLAPTILSLTGAETQALGYGRDLRRPEPTLRTQIAPLADVLKQDWGYLSSLWSFAQLNNGIRADLENGRLGLGDRYVKFPALFLLEEDLRVTEIHFGFYDNTKLSDRVAALDYDQRFVWVDGCAKTALISQAPIFEPEKTCMVAGTLGSATLENIVLPHAVRISAERIGGLVNASRPDPQVYTSRLVNTERIRDFGTSDVIEYTASQGLTGDYAIRSAGFSTGASHVVNRELDTPVALMRGLTLLGLRTGQSPVKIGHIDTCGHGRPVADIVGMGGDFNALMNQNASTYGAFAIVGHDSVLCYNIEANLEALFKGSGLVRWRELGFEQPYIALIAGNGDRIEYVGPAKTALAVHAQGFLHPQAIATLPEVIVQRQRDHLPRIAHAGGGYQGRNFTNSITALDHNGGAFELIEIDLSWTSDGQLVCLHDWNEGFMETFETDQAGPVSLEAFEALAQAHDIFENCTLETLAEWLRHNPDNRIVLDLKGQVLFALHHIGKTYPGLQPQFIAQIYQPEEYAGARALGYRDVIWTLYRYRASDAEVLKHLRSMDLLGLSMPVGSANRGLAERAQAETGVLSWVHTINSQAEFERLQALGVSEVYTDFLPAP